MLASPIPCRRRGWAVVAIAAWCSVAFLPACSKQPTALPTNAAPNAQAGNHAAIEQPLALEDIAVSIEQTTKQLETLPEKIRVRYRNKAANRGFFELPKAFRPREDFNGLIVAVGLKDARGGEPFFVYYEDDAKESERESIAVLDPDASVVVEYLTDKYCMIGHGIAPDPAANLKTCYGPGHVEKELRVYLIVDLDKMTRIASDPVSIMLSELDWSMHRDRRGSDNTGREQKGDLP